MPADTYTSVPSIGKLKLKGVTDSRIDKKKKKKKPKLEEGSSTTANPSTLNKKDSSEPFPDTSIVLQALENEDAQIESQKQRERAIKGVSENLTTDKKDEIDEMNQHIKTASELRFEEQRRKRLEERLRRDGVKTHKQRVEELNRYLSGLSEHHDMPKIGPG